MWPESFVSYKIFRKKNPILLPMYYFEKQLYERGDDIIFTMEGGYDYIQERCWTKEISDTKVHYINNGVDLEKFDYDRLNYQITDKELENEKFFNVVYIGSLRFANKFGIILDAAKQIKNPRIKFLIWGKGDELPALKWRLKDENIRNIIFKGFVEKKYVPYIVSKASLNLMHDFNMPIFRFGTSPNKMFDYMAAGKPILVDYCCKYNPVVQCSAGVEIANPTAESIARKIEDFAMMNEETYNQYCKNARKGAEQYDFENLTKKLLKIMTGENRK